MPHSRQRIPAHASSSQTLTLIRPACNPSAARVDGISCSVPEEWRHPPHWQPRHMGDGSLCWRPAADLHRAVRRLPPQSPAPSLGEQTAVHSIEDHMMWHCLRSCCWMHALLMLAAGLVHAHNAPWALLLNGSKSVRDMTYPQALHCTDHASDSNAFRQGGRRPGADLALSTAAAIAACMTLHAFCAWSTDVPACSANVHSVGHHG